MTLKNFRRPHETILSGEDTVAIHGLTTSDIAVLMDAHLGKMKEMYELFSGLDSQQDMSARVDRVIIEGAQVAPALVADIIALAAGEPDAAEQAKSLPFPIQVDALIKIFDLTFREIGGLGNFLAAVGRISSVAKANAPALSPRPAKTDSTP